MDKKKIILVTGGSGLVGNAIKKVSNLFDYSQKYNFIYISSKDYDLTCFEQTKNMFEKYTPHYVIHLAACVGGLYKNMTQNVDMFEKNLLINFNVISCAHNYKIEKLIACLSTCIFPDDVTYPINEDMLHNGPPHDSNFGYAYAKRMLEVHCRIYRKQYGDKFFCIIPTNIYGPFDNFHLENAHVLPALIHKCYLAKKSGEKFIVRGTGKPLRQFIYSQDLATLIMKLFEIYDLNNSENNINIDNIILSVPEEDEKSIADVAHIVARSFDYEENLVFDDSYADGQFKKTVSNNKLKKILGDNNFVFTDIENGIKDTIQWFNENYYLNL